MPNQSKKFQATIGRKYSDIYKNENGVHEGFFHGEIVKETKQCCYVAMDLSDLRRNIVQSEAVRKNDAFSDAERKAAERAAMTFREVAFENAVEFEPDAGV